MNSCFLGESPVRSTHRGVSFPIRQKLLPITFPLFLTNTEHSSRKLSLILWVAYVSLIWEKGLIVETWFQSILPISKFGFFCFFFFKLGFHSWKEALMSWWIISISYTFLHSHIEMVGVLIIGNIGNSVVIFESAEISFQ